MEEEVVEAAGEVEAEEEEKARHRRYLPWIIVSYHELISLP